MYHVCVSQKVKVDKERKGVGNGSTRRRLRREERGMGKTKKGREGGREGGGGRRNGFVETII